MLPIGHLAGGYLTANLVLDRMGKGRHCGYRWLGLVGGLLPDLDFLYYSLARGRMELGEDYDHHTWPSHAFPVYWLPGLLGWLWGRRQGDERLQIASVVLTTAATAHLLQDAVGTVDGVMIAWPFSRRMAGVHLIGNHGKEWLHTYLRDPVFVVELGLAGLALLQFTRRRCKR